jgi:hypothetical protein
VAAVLLLLLRQLEVVGLTYPAVPMLLFAAQQQQQTVMPAA